MKKFSLVLAMTLIALAGCISQPASTSTPVPPTTTPVPPTITPIPPTTTPVPPTDTPEPTVPTPALAYTVQVTADVEYTRPLQPGVQAQKLDVYAPEEPGSWPVVIFLPGYGANKETTADILYAKELAGRGAVVFLPNWRGSMARESAKKNGVLWREALEEIACAVRFARSGAANYGGDPGWLTVVGGRSVGESLVQALVGDESEAWDRLAAARGGPLPQAECVASEASAEVDAYVAWAEAPTEMDFLKDADPELWQLCSPEANFGQHMDLRVHFLRGAQDQRVSLERIAAFQQAMEAAGYDATLTALAEGEDGPPWSGPSFETLIGAILEAARH